MTSLNVLREINDPLTLEGRKAESAKVLHEPVHISRFSDRICRLLERVTYRCVRTEAEREPIYRLRYSAYMREGAIDPNPDERFTDPFDHSANAWVIAMYVDGGLASSIRLHIASRQEDPMPGTAVFGPELLPLLREGRTIIDPTRHVTNLEYSRRFPELPFLTVRSAWMAGEHFGADYILATVRAEHRAFFKRTFGHSEWSEPRTYPSLLKPIVCMGMNYPESRDAVEARYPHFRSTEAERATLFGCSARPAPDPGRSLDLGANAAAAG